VPSWDELGRQVGLSRSALHERFKQLRGDDGGIYLVRHGAASDRWDLTLFDSNRRDATRLSST